MLEIDDREQKDESDPFDYALSAGYRYRVLRWLGAELRGSIGKGSTSWSRERDESRTRAGLILAPTLMGTLYRAPTARARLLEASWRLGVPVGLTWVWFDEGPSRAVEARYEGGRGFSFGAVAGVDFALSANHAVYVEAGLEISSVRMTRSATVKANPSLRGEETYRYSDSRLSLGWGYALRF